MKEDIDSKALHMDIVHKKKLKLHVKLLLYSATLKGIICCSSKNIILLYSIDMTQVLSSLYRSKSNIRYLFIEDSLNMLVIIDDDG